MSYIHEGARCWGFVAQAEISPVIRADAVIWITAALYFEPDRGIVWSAGFQDDGRCALPNTLEPQAAPTNINQPMRHWFWRHFTGYKNRSGCIQLRCSRRRDASNQVNNHQENECQIASPESSRMVSNALFIQKKTLLFVSSLSRFVFISCLLQPAYRPGSLSTRAWGNVLK